MIWNTGRKLIRVWFWLLGRVILRDKLGKLVRSFGIFMRRLLRSDGDGEYWFFLFSFVVFWWCIMKAYAWCIKSKLYRFKNLFILKISTKDNNNHQIPNHSQSSNTKSYTISSICPPQPLKFTHWPFLQS